MSASLLPSGSRRCLPAIAVVGGAIVLLLALAGILNPVLSRAPMPGGISAIHLFSVRTLTLTLILFPIIIYRARAGQVAKHRRAALGLMIGDLVIAGLFTFVPGRTLGDLVFRLF